jgi:hypothetical protein
MFKKTEQLVFENERQNWQAETDRHETNMFFDDEM